MSDMHYAVEVTITMTLDVIAETEEDAIAAAQQRVTLGGLGPARDNANAVAITVDGFAVNEAPRST